MGIFCEIKLFKPSTGAYTPGQVVSGLIKYAVDEPMEVEKIITSLKGSGIVTIKRKRNNKRHTYNGKEVYVDIDNIVQDERTVLSVGSFETNFSFVLPLKLPSSLEVLERMPKGTARCKINYYIRIKFERPGLFAFNKHIKKEITVICNVTPTLTKEPVIYGETKKLTQLFSSKPNTVNIKATIYNSVILIGGKIEVHYKVENNCNVLVNSVETQLMELYYFNASGHELRNKKTVPDTDAKTTAINCGDTQNMPVTINIPSDLHTLDNSLIVSRKYVVRIEIALPFPHRNMILYIPVQAGVTDEYTAEHNLGEGVEDLNYNDPPPTYWEAMGETNKEDDDKSDGENSDVEYENEEKVK